MHKRLLGWAIALLFVGAAHAQSAGTVSLSVTPTSGTGSVTPRLTWSTNPTASSCVASGGWSGTKAASGSQTLSAITASKNFTLTCTWSSNGSAVVSWTPPTTNTDGSALTNLASYRVIYGTSSSSLTRSYTVSDPTARTATVGSLTPATWYFAVKVVNSRGVESAQSNVASKNVTGATAARTVSVNVTPSSGLVTQATNVWDVMYKDGRWVRRSVVAKIALGKPCYNTFQAGPSHYLVNRADVGTFYATPASTNLVVNCVGD